MALAGADPGSEVLRATRAAMDHVDATLEANVPPVPLACGPGCDVCCHAHVSATPMEAFALMAYLADFVSPDEYALFASRTMEARELIRGKTRVEIWALRGVTACPFLSLGHCRVYPARPFVCRGWHSIDKASCLAAYESQDPNAPIEAFAARRDYAQNVQTGLLDAACGAGLETGYMVLARAMGLLMEGDWRALYRAWLGGERIFALKEGKAGPPTP